MKNPVLGAFALAFTLVLCACASTGDDAAAPANPFRDPQQSMRQQRLQAGELYKAARAALDAADYQTAVQRYDQIILRFPFTDFGTQSELERIYAQHRGYEQDKALSNAEKFLRDHPRHSAAAYVQYLKGLINMEREESFSGLLGLDTTKEDVTYTRRAFDDFALLIQKYPQAPFNYDARQRMIYLRNRLAEHDLHVVRYYIKRGAYVAAAKRAEQIAQQYPGAPAMLTALAYMRDSYAELGLPQQAEDADKLYQAQLQVTPPVDQPKKGFWASLFSS